MTIKAKERGYSRVLILLNAHEVIKAIKDDEDWSLDIVNVLSRDFDRLEFSYIPTRPNETAYILIKIYFFSLILSGREQILNGSRD